MNWQNRERIIHEKLFGTLSRPLSRANNDENSDDVTFQRNWLCVNVLQTCDVSVSEFSSLISPPQQQNPILVFLKSENLRQITNDSFMLARCHLGFNVIPSGNHQSQLMRKVELLRDMSFVDVEGESSKHFYHLRTHIGPKKLSAIIFRVKNNCYVLRLNERCKSEVEAVSLPLQLLKRIEPMLPHMQMKCRKKDRELGSLGIVPSTFHSKVLNESDKNEDNYRIKTVMNSDLQSTTLDNNVEKLNVFHADR
ncbi:hypothetical protein DICVIV_03533 [Dictyocaulus viviparus]|uniref:Uncharacterized protein n=1 Tax=Dictyocaulus viviparus TaxID=29172 RepID=A0A0D8Y2U6_DICVI|nr:hypothetical protein DICVIV_03533 [Dictyocaulus viviparus]